MENKINKELNIIIPINTKIETPNNIDKEFIDDIILKLENCAKKHEHTIKAIPVSLECYNYLDRKDGTYIAEFNFNIIFENDDWEDIIRHIKVQWDEEEYPGFIVDILFRHYYNTN